MPFREYLRPDYLVGCVSLVTFVLVLMIVREYTRKRKSTGKKKALQRPFIKRTSPSPRRSPTNLSASGKTHDRKQQSPGTSPSVQSNAANGQSSARAKRQLGMSQPGILQQVMASISPRKTSKSLAKLVTPSLPANYSYPSERAENRRKGSEMSQSTSSPLVDRKCGNSNKGSLVEKIKVNVSSNVPLIKPDVKSGSPHAKSTTNVQPEISQAQPNRMFDEERKKDSLLRPKVHHSEVHEMEIQSHKANQTKLKELQFCDVNDPFHYWVHECPARTNSTTSPSFWAHKCSSRFCSQSAGEKYNNNNNNNKNQEDKNRERKKDRCRDVRFGARRTWSLNCESGSNARFDFETSNMGKPHTRQCEVDHFKETDCSLRDSHCGLQYSVNKPRSYDNLSTSSNCCNGIACDMENDARTDVFHHHCDQETHNFKAHDQCKHEDGEYHCLNIRVSPKRYYSLGSLCDVSICGRSHLDISPDETLEANDNSTGSRSSAECGSYNDTGYTSTEEIEVESTTKTNLDTESYDGDSEYDSEEGLVNILTFSDEIAVRPPVSISELYPIGAYAKSEWKSETAVAQAIRKGYERIPSHVSCYHLRRVRGDNYCAIRGALFQALVNNIPLLSSFTSKEDVLQVPSELVRRGYGCLEEWSFAGRMNVPHSEVVNTLADFLECFVNTIEKVDEFEAEDERVDYALAVFNDESGESEFKILEAAKLLMFNCAANLHQAMTSGKDVPVFAYLLFARDTSENPDGLLRNYLNRVGDSGGLEQVEMCLLGYSMGLVIQVIRPSQVDQEDFLAYYPYLEDVPKYTPTVTLIAEDDRHYNIAA